MQKPNPLNFRSKKQVLYSIAILQSSKFRSSRAKTKETRRLYNYELSRAKEKIKQFGIKLNKPLPKKFKI